MEDGCDAWTIFRVSARTTEVLLTSIWLIIKPASVDQDKDS